MSTNSIQAIASNPYIKDLDEYRKLYDKSIKKDKNYLDAYLNRSIAKVELNDLEGACLDAKKVDGSRYISEVNDWIKNNC